MWQTRGRESNKKIKNFYTFNGNKIRNVVEDNGTITKTDYCGAFIYETVSGTRSLKYIITPEGRAVKNGSSWDYEYNLTDHLGNVRAVIHKGAGGLAEVLQEKHYYPFGMEMSELSSGSGTNKYLYNGKELQNDFDLYWYDYGARFYMADLGRWTSVDPLAEGYYSQSPYHFSGNNPIRFIDDNGMNYDDYKLNQDGSIEFAKETESKTDDLYATKADGSIDKSKSVSVTKGSFDKEVDIDPLGETGGGCTRKKVIGEGEGYQMSNSDAAKVFEFASDNSSIEFGLIGTKNSGSVVLTNHTKGKIRASSTAAKMDKEGKTITEITHNHPSNGDPSGPDKTNAGNFPKSQGRNIGYNVYQPGNKMVVGYDKNGVVFRMNSSLFFGN